MTCKNCHGESKVLDSRPCGDGSVRRRRQCLSCDARFTTYERHAFVEDEDRAKLADLIGQMKSAVRQVDRFLQEPNTRELFTCIKAGCSRETHAMELCRKHYEAIRVRRVA